MQLQWNPLAVASHNEHRTARILYHAAHIALGLPVAVLVRVAQLPLWWAVLLALAVAVLDKCTWIDWRGEHVDWTGLHGLDDLWHFGSDAAFTIMGALAFVLPLWAWALYYPLSVVNDV